MHALLNPSTPPRCLRSSGTRLLAEPRLRTIMGSRALRSCIAPIKTVLGVFKAPTETVLRVFKASQRIVSCNDMIVLLLLYHSLTSEDNSTGR